jgi:surfeit locus 1 family protein
LNATATRSRPAWWATLATALLGALFVGLGLWQWSRAEEKRAFLAAFDAGLAATPVPAPATGPVSIGMRYAAIRATGRYDTEHQVLLDARMRHRRAGYEVLTPLIRNGRAVLVNRGWVSADPDRQRLPTVTVNAGERTVNGLLDRLPTPALVTAPMAAAPGEPWPRRRLFPTAEEIGAELGYPVEDYQLLLNPDEPDGFDRRWRPAVMTAEQHVGYAVQWFALAAALGVIYGALGFRRKAPGHD